LRARPETNRLLLALAALAATVASAAAPPHFRFERTVAPGAAGANRLEPDASLLAHAAQLAPLASLASPGRGSLADLRLFDAAGKEIPYLLIPPRQSAPEWRRGRLLPIAPTKTASGFEVDLGEVSAVDRLRLSGLRPPFLKRFRLEGGGDRSRWTLLVGQGTLFDLPDERLACTEVDFPAGEYRYLRLTWDDASSARLQAPDTADARLVRAADPAPPARFPVEVERRASEPGKSRFRLRLPGTEMPLAALELAVPGDGPLLRQAEVTEGRLGGSEKAEIAPVRLGQGTLRRTRRGGLAAADLRIAIDRPQGRDLELTVEDGNNPPLELDGVQAVLAPLPWIYFEAADAAPLTARFGDRSAAPPSYDLEAMRELAGRAHPAAAAWGALRDLAPAEPFAAASSVPQVGAPIERGRFRFARGISTGPPGLASLVLDAAVLAHAAPGLGDLRIVVRVEGSGDTGHQIPYVLERRDEPMSLTLAALEKEAAKKGDPPGLSRYALKLPYATLPAARLVLATKARVFEREVRLLQAEHSERSEGAEGSQGAGRGREPAEDRVVAVASWRHADPETPAPPIGLDLPAGDRFELVIDEGDNAPLPLEPPQLQLPSVRLRYFQPVEGSLELLYGEPGLAPPRYDLSLFSAQLLGETARDVTLRPEPKPGEVPDAAAVPRTVFWAALGIAVLALLVVLGRLLRDGGRKAT